MIFAVPIVVPHDRVAYPAQPSAVGDFVASSFLLVSDAAEIATAQAREDPAHQLRRHSSMLLFNSKSRPTEADAPPHADNHTKKKPRQGRFGIRKRIGEVFGGEAHK
jgi:hypothetical protein